MFQEAMGYQDMTNTFNFGRLQLLNQLVLIEYGTEK